VHVYGILNPPLSEKGWRMYTGQMVYAQLMEFLPRHEFNGRVRRYRGNSRVREFSCRDQFLTMAFA
jgi:hypothetical protein